MKRPWGDVQDFLCGLQRTPVGGAIRDVAEFTAGVGAGLTTVGFYLVVTGLAAAAGGALAGNVPVALGGVIVTGFGVEVAKDGGLVGLGSAAILAGLGNFRTGAKAALDVTGGSFLKSLRVSNELGVLTGPAFDAAEEKFLDELGLRDCPI